MSAKGHLENLLQELNYKSDLDIPQSEKDGSYYYTFANKFEIAIIPSDEHGQIAFHAIILDGMKKRQGLFKKLLRHNFLLSDTYGAAFALSKENGDISLSRFLYAQDIDIIEFEKQLNNFLYAADKWYKELQDWQMQDGHSHHKKQATCSMVQFIKA